MFGKKWTVGLVALGLAFNGAAGSKADLIMGPAIPVPGIPHPTPVGENVTYVSPDATYMLTARGPSPGYADSRTWNSQQGQWGDPNQILPAGHSPACLSPDGNWLYYNSAQPIGGQGEIYRSKKEGTGWSARQRVPIEGGGFLDTPGADSDPYFNGQQIYWGGQDILVADYLGGANDLFSAPRLVVDSDPWNSINTPEWDDQSPSVSSNGKLLIFNSNRAGGYGGHDLYYATRETTDSPWTNITNFGADVNTAENEFSAAFAEDAALGRLYFSRGQGATHRTMQADVAKVGPGQPSRPEAPACTPEGQSKKLILYTHGWNTSEEDWEQEEGKWQQLDEALRNSEFTEGWEILGCPWTESSGGLPGSALEQARQLGKPVGEAIAALEYDHVHLIAHSAGSALISRAAEVIADQFASTVIHTTFLDPYAPLSSWRCFDPSEGSFPWEQFYGENSDWSDNYISRDLATLLFGTDPVLPNAHNVDVTRLDGSCLTTHDWPVEFYTETINDPNNSEWEERGFVRSSEAGGWDERSNYPMGEDPVVLPSGSGSSQSLPLSVRRDGAIDVEQSASWTSDTGMVQITGSTVGMTTGSRVWITMDLFFSNPVNFLTFEALFTSDLGAEGLFGVYWDNEVIGLFDERYVYDEEREYFLTVPETGPMETHSLAFRLDPYTDVSSSVSIDNIRTGYSQVVPEPSALVALIGMAAVLLLIAWRRRRVT